MKKLIYLASCLTLVSAITSCKKEAVNPTTNNGNGAAITYTPEQNKSNLQQTGLDAMKEIDEAKNMKVIDNLIYFSELVDINDPMESTKASTLMPIIMVNALTKFKETGNHEFIYSAMKQTKSLSSDTSVESLFNNNKGIYSWNESEKKWDKTTSNSLIFKFPATKQNSGNNATYTIDYTPYTGTAAATELKGNMPSSLTAKLDIDNTNYLTFGFNANYDSEGIPTAITSNLKVENFNFGLAMTSSASEVSSKFSFTHLDKIVVAMGCTFKGDFLKSNLENLENNITKTEDANKLVTSMSAYFQILNVKLESSADVQAFTDAIKAKGGSDNINNDSEWTSLINKYLITSIFYTDKNAKIGSGEMYMKPYTETYTVWENGVAVQKTENKEDTSIRIVFEDGSKIDLETYFSNGFDKLKNEFENFLNSMENNYKI